MIHLDIQDMTVSFGSKTVIDHISAGFGGGEMTAVIGRNGAGKTTLIKAVAGLAKHSGAVCLSGDGNMPLSREEIAYVPQLGDLSTKLTVFEMVLLGLVNNLKWHVTKEQLMLVNDTLTALNLSDISKQPFNTLSGGQKQLVSMAQSMISKPKVLLLDEPTSALDLRHQLIVMNMARQYTRDTGAVTIFVVHDLMLASRYGDRLLLLHEGRVKAFDRPEQVLTPELLTKVYGVEISVERTKNGFLSAVPIAPL
ncbi:ABC transporter ATP-binding protein [Lacrimispora sp. 210928-DFI.3.58]|uniref:ABC transporter ATP-binding protein n=1 Tax=Lacrimispora sp. 210928-DFI.3.58 TaxID=2883214 RepID=UPI0015B76534|nr:ABC transporter ATP-binding protein [Lacrimispora sp. 210928-DFI.3.58]MCB7319196.1 ABC transporter ATP-binding protein [Lacrimispora sp. 210928-DFI.3.58]